MAVVNEGALKKMLKVSLFFNELRPLLVHFSKLANVIDTKLDTISLIASR